MTAARFDSDIPTRSWAHKNRLELMMVTVGSLFVLFAMIAAVLG